MALLNSQMTSGAWIPGMTWATESAPNSDSFQDTASLVQISKGPFHGGYSVPAGMMLCRNPWAKAKIRLGNDFLYSVAPDRWSPRQELAPVRHQLHYGGDIHVHLKSVEALRATLLLAGLAFCKDA